MKRKKAGKGMALILAAAMTAGLLGGCGSSAKTSAVDNTAVQDKETAAAEAESGEIQKVRYVTPGNEWSDQAYVLEQVNKKLPSSMLLLVGVGGLQDMIKEKAAALGLADKVIFTGNQADVSDYYQAMDFFVFPSVFEGLPGTVIEAQASGLRCLVSDSVTPEVLITELAQAEPLSLGAGAWAANVLERKEYVRNQMTQAIKAAGFDVSDQVKMLEKIYLQENCQ